MNDYMIEVADVLKDTTQVTRGAATPDVSTVHSKVSTTVIVYIHSTMGAWQNVPKVSSIGMFMSLEQSCEYII